MAYNFGVNQIYGAQSKWAQTNAKYRTLIIIILGTCYLIDVSVHTCLITI